MITVYLLQSEKDGTYYVGMAKDVVERLKEHNRGKSKYTKSRMPWVLIYTEAYSDWSEARKREKYFKSSSGKAWLRKQGIKED